MSSEARQTAARNALSFRFRGGDVELRHFSPRATVLDWLREDMGAKGTKEGCAEGDCGACTVVLARLKAGRLAYEPFNACILLLGQLDGAELITIEDLASGGELHPLQQAMVDSHASQCGFCTPGIVMSLFAAYHSAQPATYAGLCDQLAGNLCRCTGYRPIIAAALETCVGEPADRFAATSQERAAALAALADDRDVFVGDARAFFAAPASLESLAALYAEHPDATLVGGATDVGLWITKQLRDLKRVIWLGRVAGLDSIGESADGGLSIGAGVSLEAACPLLGAIHPDLGELLRRFGSKQVRASGTVGGNIANGSPIGDLAPGPDRAWRQGRLAQGRQDARPSAGRLFYRLWQAGSRARRVRPGGRGAAARGPPALPRLQGVQALRRGHFRRHACRAHRSRRAAHRRSAHRLRRHGGDAEACGEGGGGARRREPRSSPRAGARRRRRSARTLRRSPTCARRPPIARRSPPISCRRR